VSSSAPTIWSLGHSSRPLAELLALLEQHRIQRVVDIRRYPASRRHPHFSRESLMTQLPRSGVQYVHLVDLGGHREARPDSPHTALAGAFRGYADHMRSAAFGAALRHLEALARERRTALMCAESRWMHCHRRLLCDRLSSDGVRVLHVGGGPQEEHRTSPEVRLVDGHLLYRGTQQLGLFD
jgi:uncharacterized protein (DUF488 family)